MVNHQKQITRINEDLLVGKRVVARVRDKTYPVLEVFSQDNTLMAIIEANGAEDTIILEQYYVEKKQFCLEATAPFSLLELIEEQAKCYNVIVLVVERIMITSLTQRDREILATRQDAHFFLQVSGEDLEEAEHRLTDIIDGVLEAEEIGSEDIDETYHSDDERERYAGPGGNVPHHISFQQKE
jgi:hypothetical protein